MELRQLRYFVTVADELHFGRAAKKLHMSQPPLSVQVSRLEQEIGMVLFERSTRRVTLTAAGKHLQERAHVLLAQAEKVRAEMREFAEGFVGDLSVGFVSSANYTVLPGISRLFRERRSGVALTLSPMTSGDQMEALVDGTLDVAIVRDERPPRSDMLVDVVFTERLVACLPAAHPLVSFAALSPEQLIDVPMISYPRDRMAGYVDRVADVLRTDGRGPRVIEEVVHQETALGFIAAGAGMSVLPESVRHLVPPSIAVVPLVGSPTTSLLAVRADRPAQRPVTDAFVECLHEAAGELIAA